MAAHPGIPRGRHEANIAAGHWSDHPAVDLSEDAAPLRRGSLILVITDDGQSPAFARARQSAIGLARSIDGSILFYDRSAESHFLEAYPSGSFTSDNEGPTGDRALERGELHALGRDYLATAIRDAGAAGVPARAWLPTHTGPRGLAEAVSRFGCDLVVAPAELGRSAVLERRWFGPPRSAIAVPLLIAGADGSIREWQLAAEASSIEFEVRQFGVLNVRGHFSEFDVALEFDEAHPEATRVDAVIAAGSVSTGIGIRDRALRGRSFFDVEHYPKIRFVSTGVSRSGPRYVVAGDLEIKRQRRRVELEGELQGIVDARGHRRATLRLEVDVDRRAWELNGGLAVSDRARISIHAVAIRPTGPRVPGAGPPGGEPAG